MAVTLLLPLPNWFKLAMVILQGGVSGAVMPAKSTFFYPKTIAGFLFSSIADEEAGNVFDAVFEQE